MFFIKMVSFVGCKNNDILIFFYFLKHFKDILGRADAPKGSQCHAEAVMYTAKPCLCVLAVTRGPATSRLELQQQPKLQPKEKLSEKHHKAKQFLILQTKRITMNTKVKLTNTLNTPDKTLNAWENKILWYLAPFFPSRS